MKLEQYLENLNNLISEYGNDCLQWEVVYSKDDEGNSFQPVNFSPSVGEFDGGEFLSETVAEERAGERGEEVKLDAICIN